MAGINVLEYAGSTRPLYTGLLIFIKTTADKLRVTLVLRISILVR
jgi:hypothetical protein